MSNREFLDTPILLLAFNRPDTTERVFDQIRQARPRRLYVAVDGPRSNHLEDEALCFDVRRIVSTIDWPCELRTLFRKNNLGCKMGISSAIDWFFANEETTVFRVLVFSVFASPCFLVSGTMSGSSLYKEIFLAVNSRP